LSRGWFWPCQKVLGEAFDCFPRCCCVGLGNGEEEAKSSSPGWDQRHVRSVHKQHRRALGEVGRDVELTLLTVLFRLPSIGLISDRGRPNGESGSSSSESESERLLLWIRRGVIC